MSRKPSFANLHTTGVPRSASSRDIDDRSPRSHDRSRQPLGPQTDGRVLQLRNVFYDAHAGTRPRRSFQALMAKAANDVLRKHGESPIGD
jgi:hypothetical protein